MTVPADVRLWFRVPSVMAALCAFVLCIFVVRAAGAWGRLEAAAQAATFPRPAGVADVAALAPAAVAYWGLGTVAAVVIGAGLLLQSDAARRAMQLGAVLNLAVVHPLVWAGVLSVARRPTPMWMMSDALLLYLAFTVWFRGEPRGRLDAIRLFPLEVWGWVRIAADQVRRAAGLSYYPLTADPVAVARGGRTRRSLRATAQGVPAHDDGLWCHAGAFTATVGTLLVMDPDYAAEGEEGESGVVVDGVPRGEHRVEAQWVRLRGERLPRVARVRILWDGNTWERGEEVGLASVDSGRLSVLDPVALAAAGPEPRAGGHFRLGDEGSAVSAVFARASGAAIGVAFDASQGDGTYAVDRIERGGKPVGIMIDMTAPAYDNEILVPRRRGRRGRRDAPAARPDKG